MTRITPHFKRIESQCKGKNCDGRGNNCGGDTVDVELAKVLNRLRNHYNVEVEIISEFRCKKHNKDSGGAKNSEHLTGKAADIKVKGKTPLEVYAYLNLEYPRKYGMGLYSGWVHIDVRKKKARWKAMDTDWNYSAY